MGAPDNLLIVRVKETDTGSRTELRNLQSEKQMKDEESSMKMLRAIIKGCKGKLSIERTRSNFSKKVTFSMEMSVDNDVVHLVEEIKSE